MTAKLKVFFNTGEKKLIKRTVFFLFINLKYNPVNDRIFSTAIFFTGQAGFEQKANIFIVKDRVFPENGGFNMLNCKKNCILRKNLDVVIFK